MSSESSASLSDHKEMHPLKRKAAQAGIDGNTTGRSVKRRASKACQCCRARKVRCNVTEHGAPCTNCRLDEVECIVSESRRKKLVIPVHLLHNHFTALSYQSSTSARTWLLTVDRKWSKEDEHSNTGDASGSSTNPHTNRKLVSRDALDGLQSLAASTSSRPAHDAEIRQDEHVPHSICAFYELKATRGIRDHMR